MEIKTIEAATEGYKLLENHQRHKTQGNKELLNDQPSARN